ncbi:MAG: outer membrane protein assembly factor BamA [Candidatus Eisenbacteria bacterium]
MNLIRRGQSCLTRKPPALVIALLLLLLPGICLGDDVFRVPYVSHIDIQGNSVFSDRTLKSLMKTKERSLLRPFRNSSYRKDFLQGDVEAIVGLYNNHGHLKAKVASDSVEKVRGGRAVRITLELWEGPLTLVGSVQVQGASALSQARLLKALKIKRGVPMNPAALEEDKRRLLEMYAEAGHVYATVFDNTVLEEEKAHVFYMVSEEIQAVAGEVRIEGNRITTDRLVRREVTLKPGDILRRSELIRTQQRIYDTGLFSDVQISVATGDSVSPVPDLLILVREKKMGWTATGVGYGSSDQLRVFGEWGQRNLFGRGQRLFTSASFAFGRFLLTEGKLALDASRFDVGLVEPRLLGTRTAGQLVVYHEYKKESAFSQEFDGLTFTAKRDLSSFSKLFTSYDTRWVETTEPTAVRKHYVTRSLYLSTIRDTRDDMFDPARGSYHDVSWKVAGGVLGGNYSFHRVSFSSSRYSRLGDVVLATRFKVGFAEPFGEPRGFTRLEGIPFEERFRTGGATSVRGYVEDDELGPRDEYGTVRGGRFLVLTNAEVRFPVIWRLSAAVFLDGGNVWNNPSDVTLSSFSLVDRNVGDTDYRYTVGGGLRFKTPVGPIRIDYGRKLKLSPRDGGDRGQFHFSVGQAF